VSGPALAALRLADSPEVWRSLGFTVSDRVIVLGGVSIELGAEGKGIVAWRLSGIELTGPLDGLVTEVAPAPTASRAASHPNGAVGLDHVVVITPRFDRTAAALAAAGMPLRRVVTAPGLRQGFRRLGPVILELVGSPDAPDGPARFWGLVVNIPDLEALAERLGAKLGQVKPAVQPGRLIATLRESAGLGEAVAFMSI
jgi:hypothetical protein